MSYSTASFYISDENKAWIDDQVSCADRKRFNKSVWLDELLDGMRKKSQKKAKPKPPTVVENAVCWMPLNSGEHPVSQSDLDKYGQLYPAVDIVAEMRAMIGWLDANPTKRKTAIGITRFINSWLKRCQDKGGSSQAIQQHQSTNWNEDLGL